MNVWSHWFGSYKEREQTEKSDQNNKTPDNICYATTTLIIIALFYPCKFDWFNRVLFFFSHHFLSQPHAHVTRKIECWICENRGKTVCSTKLHRINITTTAIKYADNVIALHSSAAAQSRDMRQEQRHEHREGKKQPTANRRIEWQLKCNFQTKPHKHS